MKLSLNIDHLSRRIGLEAAVEMVKKAGFDAIDFPFFGMIHDDHPYLKDDYLEIAHHVREVCDNAEIKVNQAHAPYSFAHELFRDEKFLSETIMPRLTRSMEMASIMGAEIIIIHPIHYQGDNNEEETFKLNLDFYRSLIPYCEKFGIKVAVENMWRRDPRRGCIIHDTCSRKEEFAKYIDEINSEYIVACLDVGHVGLPLQLDEAHDVVYTLGKDRLKALHIHDNSYKGDEHVMPFFGKMNWYDLAKALGEIGYEGYFTYEIGGTFISSAPEELLPLWINFACEVLKYLSSVAESYKSK